MLPNRFPVDLRPALRAEVKPSEVRAVAAVCVLSERVLLRVEALVEAMYNGEFYPCETVVPEYRKAIQTCAALMEQLSQRLSKEDYALVEELRAQNAIAQCEESESHFKYGFSAGLIVQQEAHEHLLNKK